VRALGIDLGTKRIGVALADSAGTVATPYEVVQRSGDRARDHRRIAELAAETDAVQLVVGLPLSLDGSEGKAAALALAEVEELREATGLPVVTWDERLTTVTADRDLMLMDMKADARRRVVDKVAAAIMLQAWLDHRRLTHQEDLSTDD
jgi:putative Holliday junction resolvase